MERNKSNVSVLFMLFSILFCVCLITANVLETKQIAVGPISLTGGLI
ncbi:MAG: VUT family protein, partial [Prevotella sp.]|nr:VUT family protein [Prevotella sp.]